MKDKLISIFCWSTAVRVKAESLMSCSHFLTFDQSQLWPRFHRRNFPQKVHGTLGGNAAYVNSVEHSQTSKLAVNVGFLTRTNADLNHLYKRTFRI